KLLKGAQPGIPRVPACEIMVVNPTARKLIAEGEDAKLAAVIRGGREEGMQDFNQSLIKLVKEGYVTEDVALEASPNPEQLAMNLKGIELGSDRGAIIS
ncbi:MAG: twitching motility protein PilT, partial [Planctomycetes bacterium]|nr:twitching motility protein PilT [Planctomycetota bacterium]